LIRLTSSQLGLLTALLFGCRSTEATKVAAGRPREAPSIESRSTSASSSSGTPTNRAAIAPSVAPSAHPPALPKLKPILSKPFPEGADEATVCEAIDSTEPDLWVRFGHLIPAYTIGAIYILETGPETKDELYRYISRDYVWGYDSQQASCRGKLTLLYIRRMFDKSEYRGKPFGREHLSQAIEKKFGIKTLASFQFRDDDDRLAEYCRDDAEKCDQLVKLHRPNEGEGLCSSAVSHCEMNQRGGSKPALLASCRTLPPSILACLKYSQRGADAYPCRERVMAALCP
jgi:hypothetical protein